MQDAHEATVPTNVELHPPMRFIAYYLSEEQVQALPPHLAVVSSLRQIVARCFYDQTSVDIEAKADRSYDFRVTGSVLKFDGFLRVYEEAKESKDEEDDELKKTCFRLSPMDRN